MGGWTNDGDHPKCWQFKMGDEVCDTLRNWMTSVVAYLQGQLAYIVTA